MSLKFIDWEKKPITISKEKYYKLIALADTHMGSETAYLPSGCKDKRGNSITQTPDQVIMERNLITSLKQRGVVDGILTMGDMVEGKNPKSGGLDVSNIDVNMQIDFGVKFFEQVIEITKPKFILGIDGSHYHGESTADRQLLYLLSLKYPNIDIYYGSNLKFILGDKLWYLQHFFNGASKAGTLERYWDKLHKSHWDENRTPDVIGFAHTHKAQNPYQIMNGEKPVYGFVCPCQKRRDTFTDKNPLDGKWEIGYLYLEQDNEELWGKYYNTFKYWKEKQ
jgi:hypothetical protein